MKIKFYSYIIQRNNSVTADTDAAANKIITKIFAKKLSSKKYFLLQSNTINTITRINHMKILINDEEKKPLRNKENIYK